MAISLDIIAVRAEDFSQSHVLVRKVARIFSNCSPYEYKFSLAGDFWGGGGGGLYV